MSQSYYVMHRRGQFSPAIGHEFQCKDKDHKTFHYRLAMVFPGDMKLNRQDFILDHVFVDEAVQKANAHGSCEVMHKDIADAVEALMLRNGITMLLCKCVIIPDPKVPTAYMTHIQVKDHTHLALMPLVN